MFVKDLNEQDITDDYDINSKFLSIYNNKLQISCKTLHTNFYLDSFNYFPITKDHYTFLDVFGWKEKSEYDHFFTQKFYSNFEKEKNNIKIFNDVVVLGSSPGENYFRNLITFIPRILFIPDKEVNLAIHRNTSNNIREFIQYFLDLKQIKLGKYIYLDNGFYLFKNVSIFFL